MSTTHTGKWFTKRLLGLALAATAILGVTTQPASAMTLYSPGGGWADASALCNVGSHTVSLSISFIKDRAYATQSIQYAYWMKDLNTGQSWAGPVNTYTVSSLGVEATGSPSQLVPSTRYGIYYAVRFGTLGGYGPWSAWTPVANITTWRAKGWYKSPTSICYT